MYLLVYAAIFVVVVPLVLFLSGIRLVRPTHKGLVERLGKYRRFANPGFNWIIPVIDRMIKVNTTEQMVDATPGWMPKSTSR
jgi:regulator of protease activity HflC (stomatin/prohibitin superfamily)